MAEKKETSRGKAFVDYVLKQANPTPPKRDSGFAARMKRADNPDLEYQVWNIFLKFNVNIEYAAQRLPFGLVGAAMCRQQAEKDGTFSLGASLRSCFGDDEDQGSMRLRRLLACQTTEEACRILRPMLSLIAAKATKPLCFARLLDELLFFENQGQERIKMRWTRDFYSLSPDAEPETETAEGGAS